MGGNMLTRKKLRATRHYLFIAIVCYIFRILGKIQNKDRILVIDFHAIGDTVTLIPFIRNLKNNINNMGIDVVSRSSNKDIYGRLSCVENVICFDEVINRKNKNIIIRPINKLKYYWHLIKFSYKYLYGRYSAVFVPRWDIDLASSADLAKMSGAHVRIGFSESVTTEKAIVNLGRDKYFTDIYNCRADCLESDKYLNLLEQVGMTVSETRIELPFNRVTCLKGVNLSVPYAVLALDTSSKTKDWDTLNYIKIAKWLNKIGLMVILAGTNKEYEHIFTQNSGGLQFRSVVGKTSIGEVIDVIGCCSVYVGGDTGLSHIAGAVGVGGVVINGFAKYGSACHPNSPVRFRPQSSLIKVLQPKTGSGANRVNVEEVIEELSRILNIKDNL